MHCLCVGAAVVGLIEWQASQYELRGKKGMRATSRLRLARVKLVRRNGVSSSLSLAVFSFPSSYQVSSSSSFSLSSSSKPGGRGVRTRAGAPRLPRHLPNAEVKAWHNTVCARWGAGERLPRWIAFFSVDCDFFQ